MIFPEVRSSDLEPRPEQTAVELCRMIHPKREAETSFGSPGSVSLSLEVTTLETFHEKLTREGWKPFSPCLEMRDPKGNPVRLFCFPVETGLVMELFER